MKQVKVGVAVALAVIATGLTSQSAFAFGISEHEQITHDALGFMRTDVVEDMDGEHAQADSGQTFENRVHFDGCTIKEGSELINSVYHDAIDELDPSNPNADPWQATDDFGYLTHPTQDFYSHSNWVESGHSDLVDAGVGFRAEPGNWSQIRPDLIVAEGEMDTQTVLDNHLQAFGAGDLEAALADYADEVVFIGTRGTVHGVEGLRSVLEGLFSGLFAPGTYEFTMDALTVEGEIAYIAWHATCATADIPFATDTFVVRDGKIVAHTFGAKIDPR
jgi:hypothetical protein